MANYQIARIDTSAARTELHDLLGLTGAEISVNALPAGVSVPFVHAHRQNEEIYLVLEGAGRLFVDGRELPLAAGDCLRIDPCGERCIAAAPDRGIRFVCVQVKAGSLGPYTAGDAVMCQGAKPGWL